MLFNSYVFLLLFLPAAWLGWWSTRSPRARLGLLTGASWVFYGWWDLRFLPLMILSTTADYLAARKISRSNSPRERRWWLVALLVFNLGLLAVFKYATFLASSANALSGWLGLPPLLPVFAVILPIGISFYTFNSISYTIDVYRGRIPASASFLEFSAFVAFFPHLIAGPIIRYADIGPQFERLPPKPVPSWQFYGLTFLAIGMVKKVLIADTIAAAFVNPLFAGGVQLAATEAWLAVFSYAMQLYFDFSAYSDMAVGLGLLFGFRLPWNFDAPYQAADPAEFWRRWHMSLSTWLRDYLYIPLGGSRASTLLVARNLAVVMFLGGLWHGAAWTFVLWGVYHGLLLAGNALVERSVRPALAVPRIYRVALTFLLVCAGWALFRSPSLSSALDVLAALGGARGLASGLAADLLTQNLAACMTLIVAAGMAFTLPDTLHWRIPQRRPVAVLSGVALAVCTLLFVRPSPFLYFQF